MPKTMLAVGVAFVGALTPAVYSASLPQVDPYRIVALPDSQAYVASPDYERGFRQQVDWILAQDPADNIVFVTHVGDIVMNGAQGPLQNEEEWAFAAAALGLLEGGGPTGTAARVPYSVAIGNRDYDVISSASQGTTRYREFFGEGRYLDEPWYLGAPIGELVHAQRFESPAGPWLHVALDWRPSDRSIERAQLLIDHNPGVPVVVTTHEHLASGRDAAWRTGGATPDGGGTNDARQVFRKLIEPNPAVSLVYCGHISNGGYRTDQTIFGRDVHQILTCFQGDPNGGNGWLLTTEIDEAASLIRGRTTSPIYLPGTTPGPDRSTQPSCNFDFAYDASGHRNALETSRILHLREGLPGFDGAPWSGAVDTYIDSGVTGANQQNGDSPNVRASLSDKTEQGLLAFPYLIGDRSSQVPPGAVVRQAILTLTTEGDDAGTMDGATVHRMGIPWTDDDTWSSLVDGIQLGQDCRLDPSFEVVDEFLDKGTRSFDVTADVEAWLAGAPNYGWALLGNGSDHWSFRSSEWESLMERPQLTIVIDAPAPGPSRYCVARANSTGTTGTLLLGEPWTQSTPELSLGAANLPPLAAGILIAGRARFAAPVTDGRLCVGASSLIRISMPALANADGVVQFQVDPATSAGMLALTERWCFQAWHRDTSAQGSNFTDALEVTFRD